MVIGVLGSAVATISFTKAFVSINPSLVIVFQKFQPIIAIVLAYAVLGERISREFIFLALICLLGGFMMASTEVLSAFDYLTLNIHDPSQMLLTEKHFFGLLFTFVAALAEMFFPFFCTRLNWIF